MSDAVYLGNPNLKKANTAISFTKEQVEEFLIRHHNYMSKQNK